MIDRIVESRSWCINAWSYQDSTDITKKKVFESVGVIQDIFKSCGKGAT